VDGGGAGAVLEVAPDERRSVGGAILRPGSRRSATSSAPQLQQVVARDTGRPASDQRVSPHAGQRVALM
jgi:hypothetical protein